MALIDKIKWLGHSSILIEAEKTIYIDPYQLPDGLKPADLILITHEHFDHCSPQDIKKIQSFQTVVVGPSDAKKKVFGQFKILRPRDRLEAEGIKIEAVYAYNLIKDYHKRSEQHLGYVITLKEGKIYHAGDTDFIPEMKTLKVDIALLPIGGEYTMNANEAVKAAEAINAQYTIPIHYGSVVGNIYDAQHFKDTCRVETKILKRYKP